MAGHYAGHRARSRFSLFNLVNGLVLTTIGTLCILPLLYVAGASMSSLTQPTGDFTAYRYILASRTLINSLWISVIITAIGTLINIGLTTLTAYPLSRRDLRGRGPIQFLIVFTMLFQGGMIPTYLVVSGIGLTNSLWALWLPTAINAFYLIVLRNFFSSLPDELMESARIDGAGEWRILAALVVPLSGASIAALTLFYAVGHWNSFFSAILYLNDSNLWPVQVWLRQLALLSQGGFADVSSISDHTYVPPQNLVYAVIVVATMPVLLIYPFVQKYFVKGGLSGAVKG